MSDRLQTLLRGPVTLSLCPPNDGYADIDAGTLTTEDGKMYLRRRFMPPPGRLIAQKRAGSLGTLGIGAI